MEKKNYNLDALTGGDTDDMELCSQYGIDPAFAYTPMINDKMFETMHESSVNDMIRAGYTKGQALELTDKYVANARERAKTILKDVK